MPGSISLDAPSSGAPSIDAQAPEIPEVPSAPAPQISTAEPANLWYRQAPEGPFALLADVRASDLSAIILRPGEAKQDGDRWQLTALPPGPDAVWLEESHDWIEPLTSADPAKRVKVKPGEMRVVDTHGEAWVRTAESLDKGATARKGALFAEGAILSTGGNGSAAVMLGGFCSVRLAPSSEAKIQMQVAGGKRTIRVELIQGAAFCKVGRRTGEVQDFQVRTSFGTATADGTDFAVVQFPQRTEVWVVEGKVSVSDGSCDAFVVAPHDGVPGVERTPFGRVDPAQGRTANQETLTALLRLTPVLNRQSTALREKMQKGRPLSESEQSYLARVPQIKIVRRLARDN